MYKFEKSTAQRQIIINDYIHFGNRNNRLSSNCRCYIEIQRCFLDPSILIRIISYQRTVSAVTRTHIFHSVPVQEIVSKELNWNFTWNIADDKQICPLLLTFSGIGQKFALLEEKSVISAVLRNYRIEALERREDLVLLGELILRPKNGLRVKLTKRE